MLQIHSPQFSNSIKNMSAMLSPTYRNKRAVSSDLFVGNRINSCKKLDSPNKVEKKRSQNSQHKSIKSKDLLH